jgi:hypothetical protein
VAVLCTARTIKVSGTDQSVHGPADLISVNCKLRVRSPNQLLAVAGRNRKRRRKRATVDEKERSRTRKKEPKGKSRDANQTLPPGLCSVRLEFVITRGVNAGREKNHRDYKILLLIYYLDVIYIILNLNI